MASIYSDSSVSSSASNIYSALSAKNKGIGGLSTGLDTDALVEALTTGTRSKIAKQQQQKTLLQWKTTAYRDVISTFSSFQNKWLKANKGNSLMDYDFYSSTKAVANSDAISVKSTNYATPGSFEIEQVLKLASSKSYTSEEVSVSLTSDDVDVSAEIYTNKKLTLTVDGTTHTIALDTLEPLKTGATGTAFETELQRLITEKFGEKSKLPPASGTEPKVIVTMDDADPPTAVWPEVNFTLSSDSCHITVASDSYDNGLGFVKNASNRIDTSATIKDLFPDLVGNTFRFSINEVEFTFNGGDSMSSIMLKINTSAAGVRIDFDAINQTFKIATRSTGAGDTLRITDITGNFMSALFGAKGGSTVTSAQNTTFTLGYQRALADTFGFLSFDPSSPNYIGDYPSPGMGYSSAKDLIEAMFSNLPDTYFFDITVAGYGTETIEVDLTDYMSEFTNQLNGIFAAINGMQNPPSNVPISDYNDILDLLNSTPPGYEGMAQAYIDELEELAQTVFLNAVNGGRSEDMAELVFFKIDTNGQMSFTSLQENVKFTVGPTSGLGAGQHDLFGMLNNPGTSSVNNFSADNSPLLNTIYTSAGTITLSIGGGTPQTYTYGSGATDLKTLRELFEAIEADFPGCFTVENGVITLTGGDDKLKFDDTGDLFETLFGVDSYETANQAAFDPLLPGPQVQEGSDAEVVYNGMVLNQKNNTFEINGVEITLNEVTTSAIKITVTSSPDELIDRIYDFVEDYNMLVEAMNEIIYEKPVSGYDPLTEEQKADMSDDEIKKWENEAKKGILFNDSTLKSLMSQLRSVFYPYDPQNPDYINSVGVGAYQIGLTTISLYDSSTSSANYKYKDSGKIDTSDTQREILQKAIEENPDVVRLIFKNDAGDGIADLMDEIIKNATSSSFVTMVNGQGIRGTLVELAGSESIDESNYALGRRLKTIDERISTLKMRLEYEYNRYWKQFSNLEVAIQRMSTQMSWFDDL